MPSPTPRPRRAASPGVPALAALAALLTALGAGAARAGEADCLGFGALADGPALAVARVAGAGRVPFLRGGDAPGCPAATPACRERAFLVPGDRVILGAARGAFACAQYVGAGGGVRTGWLPAAALVREDAAPVATRDWLGTWTRAEAEITLTAAPRPGEIAVAGQATFGARDPARVARGAVNTGEIAGTRAPEGAALSFAMGASATLPVAQGGETDCRVWMRRLGPWLLVDDAACGGVNVSFRGVYLRARPQERP